MARGQIRPDDLNTVSSRPMPKSAAGNGLGVLPVVEVAITGSLGLSRRCRPSRALIGCVSSDRPGSLADAPAWEGCSPLDCAARPAATGSRILYSGAV